MSEEVAAFLRGLATGGVHETNISTVFLGSDTAWKLKKPVRLPFLDFSTCAARHRFLLRELALNARAAPGMYRDVIAVVRRPDGGLALGGPESGIVLDWVLRMALVPEQDFFESLVARGRVTPALLDRTADAVAAFHAALPSAPAGQAMPMAEIASGNVLAAHQTGLPDAKLRDWADAMACALAARADWIAARQRDGFVRRGHGDLHLGNLCLWQGAPVPFDALEFNEAMATEDVGYDLAFLLMDLEVQLGRAAANRVLNRYIARTGDAGLVAGLPVFLSMRALVRAHVQAARGQNAGRAGALRYLEAAQRALRPSAPALVAIGGLQGTGKSTLARALAPELGAAPGALVLRSDAIRKRLHDAAPEDRLPPDAYTPAVNERVHETLLREAEVALEGGHSVIADATFLDPKHRAAIAAVAARAGRPFVALWLTAPLPVLEARVAARHNDASDATPDVLRRCATANAAPTDATWKHIDALDAGQALAAAQAALRAPAPPC